MPALRALRTDLRGCFREAQRRCVRTEAQQQLAAEANITSIPTLMAFREKVLVFAQPGALNGTQLDSVIDAVKALDMSEVHATVAAKQDESSAAE